MEMMRSVDDKHHWSSIKLFHEDGEEDDNDTVEALAFTIKGDEDEGKNCFMKMNMREQNYLGNLKWPYGVGGNYIHKKE